MYNLNEIVNDYPGIVRFLNATSIAQRVEAYQQIPESEKQHIWTMTIRYGSLDHLAFIYQKKLASTSFLQSFVNLWYGQDVHDWENIVQQVFAYGDLAKLKFIIPKGAINFISNAPHHQAIFTNHVKNALKSSIPQCFRLCITTWLDAQSKDVDDALHQAILTVLNELSYAHGIFYKFPTDMIFFNSRRIFDYFQQAIEIDSIERFKSVYNKFWHKIRDDRDDNRINNNRLFTCVIKYSNSVNFCNQILKDMDDIEDRTHASMGRVNGVLRALIEVNLPENKAVIQEFLQKYEDDLIHGRYPIEMFLDLLNEGCLRKCLVSNNLCLELFQDWRTRLTREKIQEILQQDSVRDIGNLWDLFQSGLQKKEFLRIFEELLNKDEGFKQSIIKDFNLLNNNAQRDIVSLFEEKLDGEIGCSPFVFDIFKSHPNALDDLFGKLFFAILHRGSLENLKRFIQQGDHLFRYYRGFESINFKSDMRRLLEHLWRWEKHIEKIKWLDLPYQHFIELLSIEHQSLYYAQKGREITQYLKVEREVNSKQEATEQRFRVLSSKRPNLTENEKAEWNEIKHRKSEPYLKYIERGASFSLVRGLKVAGALNPSQQMCLDTLHMLLKATYQSIPEAVQQSEFIHELLDSPIISHLLPESFASDKNAILETLKNAPVEDAIVLKILDNNAFYNKGMALNFYVKSDAIENGEAMARWVENRENAMQGLSREHQSILIQLKNKYPLSHGFIHEVKRQELKDIFVARYHENPLMVDNQIMPLEFDSRLTRKQIIACQNHALHSVIRYLSVPNTWMNPNAYFVNRTQRCAIIPNNELETLWTIWLAASDESPDMLPEDGTTVENRINVFFVQMAEAARAHNFDEGRDDLQLDKPSCSGGLLQRIYRSLMLHPFKKDNFVEAKDMMLEFRRDWMFAHVKSQMNLDNYEEIFLWIANPNQREPTLQRRYNMPISEMFNFKRKISAQFKKQLPWVYEKLIEHSYFKNNGVHLLTCSEELMHLANHKAALIQSLVNDEVKHILSDIEFATWTKIYHDRAFICDEAKQCQIRMQLMMKSKKIADLVAVCQHGDDLKATFDENISDNGLQDAFYQDLDRYLNEKAQFISPFDSDDDFLRSTGVQPYDQSEYSKQEQLMALHLMKAKVLCFDANRPKRFHMFTEYPLLSIAVKIDHKIDELRKECVFYEISSMSAGG